MPAWPLALPALPIDLDAESDDNIIATEVDWGPRKKRRRYTAASYYIDVPRWHLSGVDFDVLKDFFDVQTQGGSLSFTMEDPLPTVVGTVEVRFNSRLRYRIIAPSEVASRRVVAVAFSLEILPA